LKRIQKKKWIAALLSLTLTFTALPQILPASSNQVSAAKSVQDLKKQLEENEKKKQSATQEKNSKQAALDSNVTKKNELDIQMTALQEDIDTIDDVIESKDTEIAEKNQQIESLNEQIEQNNDLLKDRLKAMYEYGTVSYLDMIFEAKGLSDLFTRISVVKDIVTHDKSLIQEFVDSKNEVEQAKKTVENEQKEKEEAKGLLVGKKDSLKQAKAERDEIIGDLKSDIKSLEAFEAESEKYEQEAKAELAAALAAQEKAAREAQQKKNASSSGSADSGKTTPAKTGSGNFCWPSASSTRISSPFGYRTHPISGTRKLHSGIDISAPYGTNVLAAADGTVVTAKWNNGYGNYITINHGGGVVTLYGHNSKLLVSPGQHVTKGQVIAKVGSTGNSTGNHVHFEVIVNGSVQNPMNYL
jgi:murein DD-endopeptidase MepM/ murein hydrolase activator NlpD